MQDVHSRLFQNTRLPACINPLSPPPESSRLRLHVASNTYWLDRPGHHARVAQQNQTTSHQLRCLPSAAGTSELELHRRKRGGMERARSRPLQPLHPLLAQPSGQAQRFGLVLYLVKSHDQKHPILASPMCAWAWISSCPKRDTAPRSRRSHHGMHGPAKMVTRRRAPMCTGLCSREPYPVRSGSELVCLGKLDLPSSSKSPPTP